MYINLIKYQEAIFVELLLRLVMEGLLMSHTRMIGRSFLLGGSQSMKSG